MNHKRSHLNRLREIWSAIKVTFQREGARELFKRSLLWLAGERRFHRSSRQVHPLPYPVFEHSASKLVKPSSETATLSIVIVLTGLPAEAERAGYLLLQSLNRWYANNSDVEVIVVTDGLIWKHIARVCNPPIRLIHQPETSYMPNRLFQTGLLACSNEWVGFAMPGVDADQWLNNCKELLCYRQPHCVGVTGCFGPTELTSANSLASNRIHTLADGSTDPRFPSGSYPGGWVEMLDMVPLHNCVLNREALITAGGFAETTALQRGYWWEACIRLSRAGHFVSAPIGAPTSRWSLNTFPIPIAKPISLDTTARLALGYYGDRSVSADLPELSGVAPIDTIPTSAPSRTVQEAIDVIKERWPARPVRITILSGPFEPHHNQIFFYNYFRLVEGQGLLSWRVIDDEYATTADITEADLIILCRVRSDNGCKMLQSAQRLGKPVLYMLDDNWFKMGSDWADYREILAPDSMFLKNALYCIRNATAVVTFSPVMHSYLSAYAAHVFEIPMNIELSLFAPRPEKTNHSGLLVGYAGSPRHGQQAFEALVKVAKRHPEVMIYYVGWTPPAILRQISPEQKCLVPGTYSFNEYARTLSRLAPDIGLAPLGTTESERSKNPTKYLDYAAVHCAGIYNRVEPYSMHVTDRETGMFVDGSSSSAWVDAIETLIADPALRTHIQSQSYLDVQRRFSTEAILPTFLKMLADLLALRHGS